jgi:hypothetical protein
MALYNCHHAFKYICKTQLCFSWGMLFSINTKEQGINHILLVLCVRHAIIHTCRKFKEKFHEARERASKALGFAKTLRKVHTQLLYHFTEEIKTWSKHDFYKPFVCFWQDLEIAAVFNIRVTANDFLDKLKETNHVKVLYS